MSRRLTILAPVGLVVLTALLGLRWLGAQRPKAPQSRAEQEQAEKSLLALALRELRLAVELQPDNHRAVDSMVQAFVAAGRSHEAIALLSRAAEESPRSVWPPIGLARLHSEQGKAVAASRQLSRAFAIAPDTPEILRVAAEVKLGDDGRGGEAAEDLIQRVLARSPGVAQPYLELAASYRLAARYDEARALAAEALDRAPDDRTRSRALVEQGLAYQQMARPEDALESFLAAASLRPDRAVLQAMIGNFYREQRRFESAIEHYRLALELSEAKSVHRYLLAYCLLEIGKIPEGIQQLQQLMASLPESSELRMQARELIERTRQNQ